MTGWIFALLLLNPVFSYSINSRLAIVPHGDDARFSTVTPARVLGLQYNEITRQASDLMTWKADGSIPADGQKLASLGRQIGEYCYGGDRVIFISDLTQSTRKMISYNAVTGLKLNEVTAPLCPGGTTTSPILPRAFVYDASVKRVFALCQQVDNAASADLIAINPATGKLDAARKKTIQFDGGLFGASIVSGSKAFHQFRHELNVLVYVGADSYKLMNINVLTGLKLVSPLLRTQSTGLVSVNTCSVSNTAVYCIWGEKLWLVNDNSGAVDRVATLTGGAYHYGLTIDPEHSKAYVSISTRPFGSTTMTPTLMQTVDLGTRLLLAAYPVTPPVSFLAFFPAIA